MRHDDLKKKLNELAANASSSNIASNNLSSKSSGNTLTKNAQKQDDNEDEQSRGLNRLRESLQKLYERQRQEVNPVNKDVPEYVGMLTTSKPANYQYEDTQYNNILADLRATKTKSDETDFRRTQDPWEILRNYDPTYEGSLRQAQEQLDFKKLALENYDNYIKRNNYSYESIPVEGEQLTAEQINAVKARLEARAAAAEKEYGADHAIAIARRNAYNQYAANPEAYPNLNLQDSWDVANKISDRNYTRTKMLTDIEAAEAEVWNREQRDKWNAYAQEAANSGWEFSDEEYRKFLDDALADQNWNAMMGYATYRDDVRDRYNYDEAYVYKYMLDTYGQAEADEYAKYLQPSVSQRINQENLDAMANSDTTVFGINLDNFVSRAMGSAIFNLGKIENTIDIKIQQADRLLTGSDRPIDYHTTAGAGLLSNALRDENSAILAEYGDLNDWLGTDIYFFEGLGLDTVYNLGQDLLNSVVNTAVFGKNLSGTAMGLEKYSDEFADAKSRRGTDTQADRYASFSALGEGIGESVGVFSYLGTLNKIGKTPGWMGKVGWGLLQMLEGSAGEALTSVVEQTSDNWFMGENSKFNLRVDNLVNVGYDPKQAQELAQKEAEKEILVSALLGFVGEGVPSAIGGAISSISNTYSTGADIRSLGNEQALASLMSTATGKDVKTPKTAYGTGRMYNNLTQNGEKYAQNIARDERDQAILEYYKQMRDAAEGEQQDSQSNSEVNENIRKALLKLGQGKNISSRQQAKIDADTSAKATQSAIAGNYLTVDNSKSRAAKAASELAYALPAIKMQPKKGTVAGAHAQADERLDEMNVDTKAKTTTVNGEEVKVTKVANVAQNDTEATVTVKKADGSTADVKISEVTFGKDSRVEVMAYAQDLDTPELANAFILTTKDSRNLDEIANAMHHAYDMAKSGFNFASIQKSTLTNGLSEHQLQSAYDLGVADKAKTVDTQQAAADARQANNASKAWQSGRINMGTVVYETLSNEQKRNLDLIDIVAGLFGMNVEVFESKANANGRFTEENGSYNKATNTIRLDINAGRYYTGDSMAQTAMLRTMSHELTHAMQRNSPKQYAAYKAAVLDVLERQGANIEELVDAKLAADSSLKNRDEAMDEVVADASETMLRDSDAIERLRELHPAEAQSFARRVLNLIKRIKDAIREAFGNGKLTKEAQYAIKELDKLAEMWSDMAVATAEASGREYSTGSEDTINNTEAFNDTMEAVQNQARPPYTDGTKACTEFVESLNTEAKATYDLLYNFYQASRLGKQNLSSKFMYYDQWNEKVRNNADWAERAKAMAATLPDDVRRKMNMNPDGTLNPTSLEVEFKMNRSMGQRIIDALETEVIDTKYTIEGTEYTLSKGNATTAVGGEAYRRAICEEVRKAYHNGTLKQAGIGTLSKDRWGSLGFLASNGKTGASGDFTTLCPQMFYNKGCHYCYRLAALKSGVNNKLVGANVWYGGEILRIKDADIDRLNKNGGLRIQSFGDWMPQFSSQLADMLYDADMRGLQIKIITKEPSMIEYVALLREQGLGKSLYFNLSADYAIERAGNRETADYTTMNTERPYMRDAQGDLWWKRAMTVQEANKFRQKYNWVNTRIVATTQEEFIRGLKDPTVDVVTGYHGNIREWERIDSETGNVLVNVEALGDAGMPRFAFDAATGEWSVEYEGKTATHKALAKAIATEGLQYEYYIKTCCITGRCATCEGKCGRLAKDFNIKNATNRDAESVAYWRQQMEYDEDVQFSVRVLEDGSKYTLIDTKEILPGNANDSLPRRVRLYMREHFRGVVLPLGITKKAYVRSEAINEYTNPAATIQSETFEAKLNAAKELDNLLKSSTFIRWEPDDGRHPDAVRGWNVWKSRFAVYNKVEKKYSAYEGEVKIKRIARGDLFYDITQIKNITDGDMGQSIITDAQSISDKPSIADADTDVNPEIQKQARSPEALSDREILANALEDVAATPEEKLRLAAYKEGLTALNEKQAELDKNKAIIRELMFKKGRTSEDSERLLKARNRAEMLAKEVDRKDKALLNLERMEPIKAIVKREGDKVRKERNAVMKERIADVRQGHENAALRKSITRRAKRLDELVRVGDKSKFVPDNLRDAVADVVSIFAQDDSVFGKKENAQGIPRWQRLQNAYEAIRQTSGDIARQYDEAIAEKLKYLHDTLDGKNIKTLNGVQLKAVRDVLMSFQKLISDGNKIFRAGRAELIEDMSNEFIEDASRAKGFYAWSANSIVKWVRDEMAIPPYFFKRLGGVFEKLGNDILRAESDWGLLVGEYNEKVHEIYKKYHHKDWANKKGDTLQFTTDSGTAIELTREQALSIYAISERQRRDKTMNSHHLDVGGIKLPIDKDGLSVFKAKKLDNAPVPISAKDVTKITAWLTEEQIGYANAMVELMSNDLAKLGNVASRQLHGWEKFQEEFYFPYVTDKSFFNTQLGKTEQLLIKDLSHAKGLAENATSPLELTDFTQTVNRHIANMILYSTFAVPQDNFMRLYDHHLSDGNTIKDRMRATYGEWTNKYIEQLMKDMYGSSPKTTSENVVDEMLGKIRNNTIKNRVLFSRTVTVQQFSSVFRAMYLINPKYFVHSPNIGGWKEAQKYAGTAVIKKMGGFDIKNSGNVVDMLMNESWGGIEGDNVLGKIVDAVDKGAGIAPATADAMTWGAIWQAVKREQAAKTGLSIHSEELKQLAGKRFDEVMRFTQVYGSTLTKSPMMRSSSATVRALATYQGETTLSFNMAYDAIWNKKNTAGQKARAFACLLITLATGAISKSLVTAIGDDDDEESVYGERVLRDFTGEMVGNFIPFNYIPIASQIWSELQGFTTTRDEFAFVSNFVKVVEVIGDEDATLDKKLRSIASFGSSMTRVPFYNIYREIKRSGDLINDIQNNGDKEKREGWATNAALSGALDQIPFYSEFAPTPVERIYNAALEGNSADAERYREYMRVYKGKDDKQINSSLRSEIKGNYENGEIDDETAIRLLTDYAGMEADEAYMKVEEWEYEYSGNGDWKKTAKVTDAIESGDDKALAAAVEELVEYGGYDSPKDAAQAIASSITSAYKPLYIAASPAERKRMKAMLLDAYETVYEAAGLEFYRDSRSKSIDKWLE